MQNQEYGIVDSGDLNILWTWYIWDSFFNFAESVLHHSEKVKLTWKWEGSISSLFQHIHIT